MKWLVVKVKKISREDKSACCVITGDIVSLFEFLKDWLRAHFAYIGGFRAAR